MVHGAAGQPSLGKALAGRFVLEKWLGSGAMGAVYQARDRHLGIAVALKVLQGQAFGDRQQLTREFRIARDIVHPNLVRLYDLVIRPDAAFFTMELLVGTPLRSWIRSGLPRVEPTAEPAESAGWVDLDDRGLDKLTGALPGIVAGLRALHDNRVVHRDVKPENVYVTGSRPVLLDFGVAKAMPQASQTHESLSGTPTYIAPEIFEGQPPTPASDAFSLGTMLYELLTGDVPFRGSLLTMIQNKQDGRWPPLGTDNAAARDLIELTTALLAPRPEARPSLVDAVAGPTATTQRLRLPLVGRADELATLSSILERCQNERQIFRVDVTGPSGIGKSRLIRGFLDGLPDDVLVLAGECHVQEDIPYKGLDGIVTALAQTLADRRDQRADLERLSSAFPGLLGRASFQKILPTRQEVVAAFRRLVENAAERATVVIFIDDAHWGTGDAAAFLDALVTPLLNVPLMFVYAYRDEGEQSPLLAGLEAMPVSHRLALGALQPNDAKTLLRFAAPGKAAPRVPELALAHLGTTPYAVTEVAQWTSDLDELPSDPLGAFVRHRLARLSDGARRLAEVAAVAGLPIRRDLLIRAAQVDAETGARQIEPLCDARLLRRHRAANTVAIYHDRVREAVLGDVDPGRRIALHEAIAEATAALNGSAALLATHLMAADRPRDAIAPAAQAAQEAMDNLSYQRAVRLFRLALEAAEAAGESTDQLREALAEAMAASGAVREAIDLFLDLSRPKQAPLRFLQRAAELLLGGGWLQEGRSTLEALRRRVGLGPMRSRLVRFVMLLLWRARVRMRGLEARPLPVGQRAALRAKAEALGTQAGVFNFYEPGGSAPPQFLHHALRVGDPALLLRAVSLEYTNYGLLVPHGSWTRRLEAKAKAIASRLDDPRALAFHELALGYVSFIRGDLADALKRFESARRRYAELRESGWEYNMARAHVILCLTALESTTVTVYRAEPFYRELLETRDLGIRAYYDSHCGYLIRLAQDDPAGATRGLLDADASVAAGSFKHAVVVGHATVSLYQGDARSALRKLSEGFWTRTESELVQVARILRRWTTGLALLACETGYRRVHRIARGMQREDAPWAAGMALSLRSGLAERQGDLASARRLAEESVSRFEAAQLTIYALPARLRAAELTDDPDEIVRCLDAMLATGLRRPDLWARCQAPWVLSGQARRILSEQQRKQT